MADILVRDLDTSTVERLKVRAKRSGRSLQGEAKLILEGAAGLDADEARDVARRWRRALAGRQFQDSAAILREDRRR